jgi:hypothetical protein
LWFYCTSHRQNLKGKGVVWGDVCKTLVYTPTVKNFLQKKKSSDKRAKMNKEYYIETQLFSDACVDCSGTGREN